MISRTIRKVAIGIVATMGFSTMSVAKAEDLYLNEPINLALEGSNCMDLISIVYGTFRKMAVEDAGYEKGKTPTAGRNFFVMFDEIMDEYNASSKYRGCNIGNAGDPTILPLNVEFIDRDDPTDNDCDFFSWVAKTQEIYIQEMVRKGKVPAPKSTLETARMTVQHTIFADAPQCYGSTGKKSMTGIKRTSPTPAVRLKRSGRIQYPSLHSQMDKSRQAVVSATWQSCREFVEQYDDAIQEVRILWKKEPSMRFATNMSLRQFLAGMVNDGKNLMRNKYRVDVGGCSLLPITRKYGLL